MMAIITFWQVAINIDPIRKFIWTLYFSRQAEVKTVEKVKFTKIDLDLLFVKIRTYLESMGYLYRNFSLLNIIIVFVNLR